MGWGQWERLDGDASQPATLIISQETPTSFSFGLEAMNGGNSGEVLEQVRIKGQAITLAGEEGCHLDFKLEQRQMRLEAGDGCLALAGMGMYFSGRYARAGQPILAPPPAPLSAEERALSNLPGEYIISFPVTPGSWRARIWTGLGATVRSYDVCGLGTA
ncbi:hypothetical protein DFAR_220001 [Desulfarculales bacterium]